MIRRPPRSTPGVSSAASDVYQQQHILSPLARLVPHVGIFSLPRPGARLPPRPPGRPPGARLQAGGPRAQASDRPRLQPRPPRGPR
eukprot:3058907-Pyramimonas_sp.AAC.1